MKNKLFYIVFTLLFTVLGSSTVFAQTAREFRRMPPQEKAELRADVVSERLVLDKSQQKQVESIYLKHIQERVALRKKMQHSPERKALMQKIRQSEVAEVKAVLNTNQRTTFTKILSGEEPKLNFRNRASAK